MIKKKKKRVLGGWNRLASPFIAKLFNRSLQTTRKILRNFGTYDNNNLNPEILAELIWAIKTDDKCREVGIYKKDLSILQHVIDKWKLK